MLHAGHVALCCGRSRYDDGNDDGLQFDDLVADRLAPLPMLGLAVVPLSVLPKALCGANATAGVDSAGTKV